MTDEERQVVADVGPTMHESQDDSGLIQLWLEEYRSLRAEIQQRIASRVQLLSFTVAAAGLMVAAGATAWVHGMAGALVSVGALYWIRSRQANRQIAAHLRKLEVAINERFTLVHPGIDIEMGPLSWEACSHAAPGRGVGWS